MPLKLLNEYEEAAVAAHGHLCAGQILGLRMALYGLWLLGIEDTQGPNRKRLVTFVEIDRCATDAISLVTGCRLGKRSLKFVDYGKAAATFCDLREDRAVRISALENSREAADRMHPELSERSARQMMAYRELPDTELFRAQWVRISLRPQDMPGFRAPRVICAACGEGVSFGRETLCDGVPLCRPCAGERYYEPVE